jgi:hypothetical protein
MGPGNIDQSTRGLGIDGGVVVQKPDEIIAALSRGTHSRVAPAGETQVFAHLEEKDLRKARSDFRTGFVARPVVHHD